MTAPALATRQGVIAEAASDAGIAVASHDDADDAAVERAADHGVDICEFPLTMAAARRAATREMPVVMGAPNLVRGGSLWDNLDARAATEAGLVDVFCSDFRSQTLLRSAFVDTGEPLHERVNRITSAPADVVGLTDRGRLAPGHRADVLVVDPDPTPTVSRAFVGGDEVYRFNCGG
jgi:alpha-D-ribose 1-methylphosphonate 5-triphosphate diphosphatase